MWNPMLPWGFPLTLLLKSKEFTTLYIDLKTGSQEEWQSNAESHAMCHPINGIPIEQL